LALAGTTDKLHVTSLLDDPDKATLLMFVPEAPPNTEMVLQLSGPEFLPAITKVTFPVGAPEPGGGPRMTAVSVSGPPATGFAGDAINVVVEVFWTTACGNEEVLPV
jgi:hypothetical protein